MKMSKLKSFVFAGLLLMGGMVLAQDKIYTLQDSIIDVTQEDSNFIIKLEYNVGTGYSWGTPTGTSLFTIQRVPDQPVKRPCFGAKKEATWKFQTKSEAFNREQTVTIHFPKIGRDGKEVEGEGKSYTVTIHEAKKQIIPKDDYTPSTSPW